MNIDTITPLILTYNEDPNIEDVLSRLSWAKRIVLIDSGSNDETVKIAQQFPNVDVIERTFDNHTNQWNYGLDQIKTEWVLTLDADYRCSDAMVEELCELAPTADVYFAGIRYCILGRTLKNSLYPARAVLFRPSDTKYIQDGHTQLLDVANLKTSRLKTEMLHDDWKSVDHWCQAQIQYARLELQKLLNTKYEDLNWKDRLRTKIVIAPPLICVYCLFYKRMVFDGWHGLCYTMERVFAELLLSLMLIDRRLRSRPITRDSKANDPYPSEASSRNHNLDEPQEQRSAEHASIVK